MICMPTTPNIDQARESVIKTIKSSTPLSALVGAGDLAFERLRALRADVVDRAGHIDASNFKAPKFDVDPKTFDPRSVDFAKLAEDAKALAAKAQEVAQHYAAALSEQAKDAPAEAQAIPAKAQAAIDELVSGAVALYGSLAKRGQAVVAETSSAPSAAATTETVKKPVAKKTTVKKTAAKAPVKKTTASRPSAKSTATKTTAQKTAARNSVANKSSTKQS
jgi:heparin binding hemagglutinin HbhA